MGIKMVLGSSVVCQYRDGLSLFYFRPVVIVEEG